MMPGLTHISRSLHVIAAFILTFVLIYASNIAKLEYSIHEDSISETGSEISFKLARNFKTENVPLKSPPSNLLLKTKLISSSSNLKGSNTFSITDGKRLGFIEQKDTFFSTIAEEHPWVKLQFQPYNTGDHFRVLVWPVESACLSKLSLDKKRNIKCRESIKNQTLFSPSYNQTLKVELLSHTEYVVGSMEFKEPRGIYFLRTPFRSGVSSIRISIDSKINRMGMPKKSLQLQLAEVEVWTRYITKIKTSKTCSDANCYSPGGFCTKDKSKCVCKRDYIGSDCLFNVKINTRYLPLQFQPMDAKVSEWARNTIEKIQASCKDPSINNILPGPTGKGAGFGSTIMWRTGQFSDAFMQNKAYIFQGSLNYAENNWCKDRGLYGSFECYFEKEHNCSARVKQNKIHRSKRSALSKAERNGPPSDKRFDMIPRKFSKIGLFFWRAEQVSWILRLNEITKKELDLASKLKQINAHKNTIGVHVRHGDGCMHGRRKQHGCKPLVDYIKEARTLRDIYDPNHKDRTVIYLATDSVSVIQDTKKYKNEFIFIFQKMNRELMNSSQKIENRFGKELDSHKIMVSTLVDIFLLSACDFLVTHQASALSRISLHLATVRLGYVPPYVSMDGPWCYHWRMCCDISSNGRQKSC